MLSDFKEYAPETSDYWHTPAGINTRISMLGEQFTYKVVNNSLQVYGETYGAEAFIWITHPELTKTGPCPICSQRHGHMYKPGQFLPSMPAHGYCVCQWEIVWGQSQAPGAPTTPPEQPPSTPPKAQVGYEGGYNSEYTYTPRDIHGGEPTPARLNTFNREFQQKYEAAKELYRGVRSDKALDDLLEKGVISNLNPETPVSLSINPTLSQMFTYQKERGMVMVFDKDKIASDIIVPTYEKIEIVNPYDLNRSLDTLPSWFADQEEVRGINIKVPEGGLKGILVNSDEAVDYYKKKYPSLSVQLVPDEVMRG